MPSNSPTPSVRARIAAVAARYDGEDGQAARLTAEALGSLGRRLRLSGKRCERCRAEQPLAAFSVDSREHDARRRYCRACDAAASRRRRERSA